MKKIMREARPKNNIIKKTDRILILRKTEDTPAIILNPEKGKFQLIATSWPENAVKFYKPIHDWCRHYFDNEPLEKTIFEFKLNYLNTSSSKQIAKFFYFIKEKTKKHNIIIQWYYEKEDLDSRRDGERYADILDMTFEIIEVKSIISNNIYR